ncbi:MAG: peptidylprolyl isomerase [bacterium]
MKKIFLVCLFIILIFSCAQKEKVCVLQTNYGTMVFKFYPQDAPNTCAQIQKLVKEGFYDGKEFYRVVKGHVIQTGGGGEKIQAEFNDNKHIKGTVGLARDKDPDSGDSSFYICLAPRPHLDGKYTVFGQLIQGMDVLEKIGDIEVNEKFTGEDSSIAFHEPVKPVIIEKASIELQ